MPGKNIFSELKVLDLSTSVVGPGAARLFADYGATVVKVESMTHPEALRTSPPYPTGKRGVNLSGYYSHFNAGKLSLSLNLNLPRARELILRLVKWADVVVESFTTGIMERWELTYERLREIKPAIIMVSTNMLGQAGPFNSFRGYGQHGAALAGWDTTLGYPDHEPVLAFGAYTDYIASRYVAIAILAALDFRRRTGQGQYMDISQVESSIDFMTPLILQYGASGQMMKPDANRDPSAAPHGAYKCRGEDSWCAIAVASEEQWRAFCRALAKPDWVDDPRFASLEDRKKNEDALDQSVEQWTLNCSAEEVVRLLQKEGVPAGVVQSARELVSDPQLTHRGHFQRRPHPEMGLHNYETFGFRLSEVQGGPQGPAPCLGEHTNYVCTEILKLSDEEFVELLSEGVLE